MSATVDSKSLMQTTYRYSFLNMDSPQRPVLHIHFSRLEKKEEPIVRDYVAHFFGIKLPNTIKLADYRGGTVLSFNIPPLVQDKAMKMANALHAECGNQISMKSAYQSYTLGGGSSASAFLNIYFSRLQNPEKLVAQDYIAVFFGMKALNTIDVVDTARGETVLSFKIPSPLIATARRMAAELNQVLGKHTAPPVPGRRNLHKAAKPIKPQL